MLYYWFEKTDLNVLHYVQGIRIIIMFIDFIQTVNKYC